MKPQTAWFIGCCALVACGTDVVTGTQLTLAPTYHLRTVNGASIPIVTPGGTFDSGTVTRHGADSILIRFVSHANPTNGNPPLVTIQVDDGRVVQIGSTILLYTIYSPTPDTGFVSHDTLIVRDRHGATPQLDVFVAP